MAPSLSAHLVALRAKMHGALDAGDRALAEIYASAIVGLRVLDGEFPVKLPVPDDVYRTKDMDE